MGEHNATGPVMVPGIAGATVESGRLLQVGELVPQEFTACTQMLPVVYNASKQTLMDVPVDEPVACNGSVQTYDVAPLTAAML